MFSTSLRVFVGFLLTAGLCLALKPAHATDLTVSWEAVTQEAGTTPKPLPAGAVTYEVIGAKNGGTPTSVGSTTATSMVRPNLSAGTHCYVVRSSFAPAVPDGSVWEPSAPSLQACATIAGTAGPRSTVPPANVKVVISKP